MNKRPGFTLMELLVYLGMTTIIVLVISKFMVDVSQNAARNRASLEVQSNSRFIMSRITQEVRTSTEALSKDNDDPAPNVIVGGKKYCLRGRAIVTTDLITTNCESLADGSFEYMTNDKVQVSLDEHNNPLLSFSVTAAALQINMTLTTTISSSIDVPEQSLSSIIYRRQSIYQS